MSLPTQPFVSKTADEILGELMEQVVVGTVPVYNEEYTFSSGTNTYELLCGSPDITNGVLINIDRVWGIKGGSYYEFSLITEFTVDLTTNEITFSTDPDDNTTFAVTYRYDQRSTSGITDVSVGSLTLTLLQASARQFAAAWRSLELVKASAYIDTALGDDLNELVKLVGIERNPASVASGYVSFYRTSTSGETTVNSGVQVAAPTTSGDVIYATQETGHFRDGFSSVRVPIQANAGYAGKFGNMAPNHINKILTSTDASSCNNPAYYTDYEFIMLTEGNYTYVLDHPPRRVVNSSDGSSPPWLSTDKGIIGILGFRDASMITSGWSSTEITFSQDDPETGQLKVTPGTTSGALMTASFEINQATYTHVFVMMRGTQDDVFEILIDGTTASVYPFPSTSSSTAPTVNTNWTLYCGEHGETSTSAASFTLGFSSTSPYWIDFVGVGMISTLTSTLTNEDQVQVNYTARTLSFWYSSSTENFYQKYDGDDSDGKVDYCFVYYQWDNHVSGGGDEETDDDLRLRAREALTVAAKGTKEAVKNAVLAIEGISQCEVSDYNDDITIDPGVCHVYVLARGYTLSPSLNQEIVDIVDDVRAAGIQVKIFAPQVRYTNFTLNVVYDDSITDYVGTEGREALEAVIESAMDDFFADAVINEALYFSELYGYLIDQIAGVVAAYVDWDDSTTPTYSDDDYDPPGGYIHGGADVIMKDDPNRVTGYKADATVVVQGGNGIVINLLRKSEHK